MNFELGPDELQLIDAVRAALSRTDTLAAAREALDGAPPVHLWKEAVRGGWTDLPGLLYGSLVLIECGRRLAPTGLVGHLSARTLVPTDKRAAFVPVLDHVPDVVDADVLVLVDDEGAILVEDGVTVEPVGDYDKSRPLGNVRVTGELRGRRLDGDIDRAWNTAQTLLAAEALGAAEAALDLAVSHAKQRKAFGRAIGSFQAVKHQLTDALRLNENARSLLYFAAYAYENAPDEFGLAANAARFAADTAIDVATRRCIAVHGGIGATWEHDAHLYFRRAQLTRLLLGGQRGAGERVVAHVLG